MVPSTNVTTLILKIGRKRRCRRRIAYYTERVLENQLSSTLLFVHSIFTRNRNNAYGTAEKAEYNVKEQTRKRRGFKSGFAWSNRAKSKLASSNAQKAKREEKGRNRVDRGKNVEKQGMATIMITEVQEKW